MLIKAISAAIINEGERHLTCPRIAENVTSLYNTTKFHDFFKLRSPLVHKLAEIHLIQTKDPEKLNSMMLEFYTPIAQAIDHRFLRGIKTNQLDEAFKEDVLQNIALPPINTHKRQFIFSNISIQALQIAQSEKTESIILDFLCDLFVNISKYINLWASFFSFKMSPAGLPRGYDPAKL